MLGFDFIKPGNEGDVRRIWAMRVITLKEKSERKTIKKLLNERNLVPNLRKFVTLSVWHGS